MDYFPPINGDTGNPNRPYVNANPGAGIEGSWPHAKAIEGSMREILHVIETAGIEPNGEIFTQLYTAIQTLIASGAAVNAFTNRRFQAVDEKASGTNGGTFTSGAYRTRDLNTIKANQIPGAALAANQITLPAGTYFCMGSAIAYSVDGHRTRIQNITDNAPLIIGQNAKTDPAGGGIGMNPSIFSGQFTIAATKVIELQHRCNTTQASIGFGTPFGWTDTEVYSNINIWKIA